MASSDPPNNSLYDKGDALLITLLVGILNWRFAHWQYMPHFTLLCALIYISASKDARSKLKMAIFNPFNDILSLVWRKPVCVSINLVNLDELQDCQVIGIRQAQNTLEDCLVRPARFHELFDTEISSPPKGILLFGPSGTGKTLVVSKYAKESKHKLLSLRASNLLDKFVGNTEKHIAEVFEYAERNSPCIIFIDEIDCLVQKRNSEGPERAGSAGITSELLSRMDGLLKLKEGVTVIAATNFPWLLDEGFIPHLFLLNLKLQSIVLFSFTQFIFSFPAFLQRFSARIYVELPNKDERLALLQTYLQGETQEFTNEQLADFANRHKGYSGREIRSLMTKAVLAKNREIFDARKFKVQEDGSYIPVKDNGDLRPSVNWFKAVELTNLKHLVTDTTTETALYVSPGKQVLV